MSMRRMIWSLIWYNYLTMPSIFCYTMDIMNKKGNNMYKISIGNIVYLYDNDKDARRAYHDAVTKNGINNVQVTYVGG